ncbi:MAG: DUF2279 domain-containing protein [bacterium]|nr:DUF2279 domain-containing protein [bacterium]
MLILLFTLLVEKPDSTLSEPVVVDSFYLTCQKTGLLEQYEDEWFTIDKFHHFSYSFGATALIFHVYHCQLNNPTPGAQMLSISTTALFGIGKEVYDKFCKKTLFSYKDLTFDVLGITTAVLLFAH